MKLYHGSEKIVETPQFGAGNPRNDYGLGFYCTQNLELAKEWVCQKIQTVMQVATGIAAGFFGLYHSHSD
jgi:hypothetical protein